MNQVNLHNPIEVRNAGLSALKDALGPVGMVQFKIPMGVKDTMTAECMQQNEIFADARDAENGLKFAVWDESGVEENAD